MSIEQEPCHCPGDVITQTSNKHTKKLWVSSFDLEGGAQAQI